MIVTLVIEVGVCVIFPSYPHLPAVGIDLMEMGSAFMMVEGDDTARKAWNMRKKIREYQESFTVLERVRKLGRDTSTCPARKLFLPGVD